MEDTDFTFLDELDFGNSINYLDIIEMNELDEELIAVTASNDSWVDSLPELQDFMPHTKDYGTSTEFVTMKEAWTQTGPEFSLLPILFGSPERLLHRKEISRSTPPKLRGKYKPREEPTKRPCTGEGSRGGKGAYDESKKKLFTFSSNKVYPLP